MPKAPRWHERVKEVLKEIGESRGYDVSESEQEMMLSSKFKMFSGEKRKIHTSSYKPDVVWKKNHEYRAIFEIEYLSPSSNSQLMDKRKYSIGSFMLAYIAMIRKSVKHLVFITNNDRLCEEIAKFIKLAKIQYSRNIWYLYEPTTRRSSLRKSLEKTLVNEWKI